MLKDIYKRLLIEMVANCKRSDRELAKALGVSQPTITRARGWLEKNGFIREYTVIPEFSKIGLEIIAFTLIKLRPETTKNSIAQIQRNAESFLKRNPNVVTAVRGEGFGCDYLMISFHKDYAEFIQFSRNLKLETANTEVVGSFVASLKDPIQYRYFTFRTLKEYLAKQ